MELTDTFVVNQPVETAWGLLTDPVRVARCVPGAHLTEVAGDDHHGVVNLRLGVLQARFTGIARFEPDPDRQRIIVRARGDGNQGPVDAHVTARLEALSDDETQVNVDADLQLDGRVAQLSRGILTEVSSTLTAQFAANLNASLSGTDDRGADLFAEPDRRGVAMPEPEALDLLDAARRPIMKRLVPLSIVATGIVVTVRSRRRGRR